MIMAKRIAVVVSQGQSANPAKRQLEEDIVGGLLWSRGSTSSSFRISTT